MIQLPDAIWYIILSMLPLTQKHRCREVCCLFSILIPPRPLSDFTASELITMIGKSKYGRILDYTYTTVCDVYYNSSDEDSITEVPIVP
jgi:hypothetical protein